MDVKSELDAFLYDAFILDYRAGQDNGCKLRVVGSWYSMTGYGIALPKFSKYREMFDREILEFAHTGDLERAQNFWFTGTCGKDSKSEKKNSQQVGLLQSTSVFFLLSFGIVLSVIVLVVTKSVGNYIASHKRNVWTYERKREDATTDANADFRRSAWAGYVVSLMQNSQQSRYLSMLSNSVFEFNLKRIKHMHKNVFYLSFSIFNSSQVELNETEKAKGANTCFSSPMAQENDENAMQNLKEFNKQRLMFETKL